MNIRTTPNVISTVSRLSQQKYIVWLSIGRRSSQFVGADFFFFCYFGMSMTIASQCYFRYLAIWCDNFHNLNLFKLIFWSVNVCLHIRLFLLESWLSMITAIFTLFILYSKMNGSRIRLFFYLFICLFFFCVKMCLSVDLLSVKL